MAQKKAAKKGTQKAATTKGEELTEEERAARRETVSERKAATLSANGEKALLAKIAEMPAADRSLAKRIHEIVKASAPSLSSKTWYGMTAYYKGGKAVCFFQSADKFKAR